MPSNTMKTTTAALALAFGLLAAQPATAADDTPTYNSKDAFTFGVIGDIPYGDAEIAKFPSRIQDINADRDLGFVAHVGDIKNGSSVCSDGYFSYIRAQFDTFEHPLFFTPGDNEWVDCHRTNNGAYNPLERLDKLREVFFDEPGKTLGATMPVKKPLPRPSSWPRWSTGPMPSWPRSAKRSPTPGAAMTAPWS
jgi:hypothetical protein